MGGIWKRESRAASPTTRLQVHQGQGEGLKSRRRGLSALAFGFFFYGDQQFKAHLSVTLITGGKFLVRLESSFVGQAVLGVRDLIDPRLRDHLARFVKRLAGIGSHALCRVALGT